MPRIADLYPGKAKEDAKDAFNIAGAAPAMPHRLRAIDSEDETIAELEMIIGFDEDVAGLAGRSGGRARQGCRARVPGRSGGHRGGVSCW
ncbi:IS110 family transposase [Streptomyces chryseus]